ncbi:multicopper oxidase family protein [Halorussus caseinilyticus]|uniref:multicopper oxidase family protein n=1 Tax=Halorussus caseinilyticus TaxID=3034025 RepID=UPI0023E8BE5B|nr:multicopper oxidase domain-containing protein [Halorussus sp. DT72]
MGLDTTVWGYGGSYPAPTIEARPDRPVEVEYINNLPTDHLLSVDERVHGAEPPAPESRTVTHLHGGVTGPRSDGYPEAWVDPNGNTAADFPAIHDSPVPHQQVKEYPNKQEPATLWYHDHALGATRLNVYAGLAGFYLLRDPMENSLPKGDYEVPIVIQDRSFNSDGSLQYSDGTDDDYEAEFFGDVPVVNGKAYPYIEVEPRKYRFRFLNGSNGRVFNLNLRNETAPGVPTMNQIATDLGFLDSVATIGPGGDQSSLLLGGAERADIVIDFSDFEGQTFTLTNNAPTPYAGETVPISESDMPEIMRFKVTDSVTEEDETIPLSRFLTQINKRYPEPDVTDSGTTRYMTLDTGTLEVAPGIEYDSHFLNRSQWTDEEAVVQPTFGTSEEWVLANVTGDSHPIHLHLADFEVVGRRTFNAEAFDEARQAGEDPAVADYLEGPVIQPDPGEQGPKDTVLVNPNEAAIIRPAFTGFTGRYVWHCHILEHEDQEMMLPYEVVPDE